MKRNYQVFIVKDDSILITNFHTIRECKNKIKDYFNNETYFKFASIYEIDANYKTTFISKVKCLNYGYAGYYLEEFSEELNKLELKETKI